MALQSGKTRLQQLEGLRIIAIIMIMLSHMEFLCADASAYPYSAFYKLHLHNPDLGVDYFFMLSGFGMLMASLKGGDGKITLKGSFRFAWGKIRKIFPFYLVSMALMIPFALGTFRTGQVETGTLKALLLRLPFALTLTQSMTGIRSFSRLLNSVCWFLSSLAVIYLVSPLLISFLKKRVRNLKQAVTALAATFVSLLLFTRFLLLLDRDHLFGLTFFNDLFYSSPYIRVFYVAIGMEIGLLFSQLSGRCRISTRGEVFAAAVGFLYYWCKRLLPEVTVSEIIWVRAIDVAVCMTVLGVFSLGSGRLSSALGRIGNQSGCVIFLFLFHYPILYYISQLFELLNIRFGVMTGIVETLVIFVLSVLTAMACRKRMDRKKD